MEEVHTKNKFTQWCLHILMSIFTSSMKVTKIGQKYFLWTFWGFLVMIICDIKIDINMCEPHYVNLFFGEPPHQIWCQIWRSLKIFKNTFYAHFEDFWSPSYVISKLVWIRVNLIMSIHFFVNLLHSPCVWLFEIWHLFDNLTSFDIFLITSHLFNILIHGQWGTWAMGHMGEGVSQLILQIEMRDLGG